MLLLSFSVLSQKTGWVECLFYVEWDINHSITQSSKLFHRKPSDSQILHMRLKKYYWMTVTFKRLFQMNTERHRKLAEITEWKALQWEQCKLNVSKPANNILDLLNKCLWQPTKNKHGPYMTTFTTMMTKILSSNWLGITQHLSSVEVSFPGSHFPSARDSRPLLFLGMKTPWFPGKTGTSQLQMFNKLDARQRLQNVQTAVAHLALTCNQLTAPGGTYRTASRHLSLPGGPPSVTACAVSVRQH